MQYTIVGEIRITPEGQRSIASKNNCKILLFLPSRTNLEVEPFLMLDPNINTVLKAFIILLKGDKKVLGDIQLISLDKIRHWISARVSLVPLEVRSAISFDLKKKSQFRRLLKKTVDDRSLTPDVYRVVASTVFQYAKTKDFSVMRVDEEWVRLFVFLFNLSKQISEDHIDHEILSCNYSSELIDHFEEDFEFIWAEGDRYRSQIFNFYYILHIYEEFNIYNWRFFETINELITGRFKEIRYLKEPSGRLTFRNPQSLFT